MIDCTVEIRVGSETARQSMSGPNSGGWGVLSRLGRDIHQRGDARALQAARGIDRDGLHPSLLDDPLAKFYRGAYDVAVFLAFRQVAISVRKASGVDDSGTKLKGKAFNSPNGPLRDPHGLRQRGPRSWC